MEKPRITLQDVARRANVSTATVSRCLSSPDQVRPKLREKVQTVISELGYAPHGAARALASQRNNTIGAIIPTLDNAIFAAFIETLQQELSSAGRTLLLASSGYDPLSERDQIQALIVRGIDGLMLTGENREPSAYTMLNQQGVRYVNTYVHHPTSPHPTIGFDNIQAMDKAVSFLHDLGHHSIGMIGGIRDGNDRAAERIAGTGQAMERRGLHLRTKHLCEKPYGIAGGRDGFRYIMSQSEPPTALLCGNDVLAIGAVLEAEAMGFSVPDDVSIIGFDDLDLAKEIPPGLTTIHAPLKEMGQLTAKYLIEQKPNQSAPLHLELPTKLVVRGSTGPLR